MRKWPVRRYVYDSLSAPAQWGVRSVVLESGIVWDEKGEPGPYVEVLPVYGVQSYVRRVYERPQRGENRYGRENELESPLHRELQQSWRYEGQEFGFAPVFPLIDGGKCIELVSLGVTDLYGWDDDSIRREWVLCPWPQQEEEDRLREKREEHLLRLNYVIQKKREEARTEDPLRS